VRAHFIPPRTTTIIITATTTNRRHHYITSSNAHRRNRSDEDAHQAVYAAALPSNEKQEMPHDIAEKNARKVGVLLNLVLMGARCVCVLGDEGLWHGREGSH
jgi:hypothetical protein